MVADGASESRVFPTTAAESRPSGSAPFRETSPHTSVPSPPFPLAGRPLLLRATRATFCLFLLLGLALAVTRFLRLLWTGFPGRRDRTGKKPRQIDHLRPGRGARCGRPSALAGDVAGDLPRLH